VISRWIRASFSKLVRPLLAVLANLGLTPNGASLLGLALVAAAGATASQGRFFFSGVLFSIGGLLDALDGELARSTGRAGERGAFLDSLCDHCGDCAMSLGLVWFYLPRGALTEVLLVFVALFASMLGSHVRSRAASLGIDLKDVGFATRCERMFVLGAGLLLRRMRPALVLLAVIGSVSTAQRIAAALRSVRVARASEAVPRPSRVHA
jgi:CDP-diacylglycerol--glycerol-3-phosphate 3-phosphatidyltransferase